MRPDAGELVEDQCRTTRSRDVLLAHGDRVLKKQGPVLDEEVRRVEPQVPVLAGEPLDEPTANQGVRVARVPISTTTGRTETGWPILTACPGIEKTRVKLGSPSFPAYGYR
jgi:propionyl-CoA synthetase